MSKGSEFNVINPNNFVDRFVTFVGLYKANIKLGIAVIERNF